MSRAESPGLRVRDSGLHSSSTAKGQCILGCHLVLLPCHSLGGSKDEWRAAGYRVRGALEGCQRSRLLHSEGPCP